jgi:hypothetical protein
MKAAPCAALGRAADSGSDCSVLQAVLQGSLEQQYSELQEKNVGHNIVTTYHRGLRGRLRKDISWGDSK